MTFQHQLIVIMCFGSPEVFYPTLFPNFLLEDQLILFDLLCVKLVYFHNTTSHATRKAQTEGCLCCGLLPILLRVEAYTGGNMIYWNTDIF
jgi:hypothetical protein